MQRTAFLLTALNVCALAVAQGPLPGTAPLTMNGDLAAQMVDGIHRYLDRELDESVAKRPAQPSRERLRKIIGAVDARRPVLELELLATTGSPALIAKTAAYSVYAVRWPVLEGVNGEGLLLQPVGQPVARVVAIPDADVTPEMLAGLAPGIGAASQFARRLADNGCQVLVPVLIDRKDTWSGAPGLRMTNQPHREFIYRMAFETGRHIIGYEVQKVLAAIDWFEHENIKQRVPLAVAGHGEGGLLALYSAALDDRISATLVSGYFGSRQTVWREPIYRDVWGLLREFGDAELARLIAPRRLIVEAARGPEVAGPPPETKDRTGAAPVGVLTTPSLASVKAEIARSGTRAALVESEDGDRALSMLLGVKALKPSTAAPRDGRVGFDPDERLHRQFDELVAYTQLLVRRSPMKRAEFWAKADSSSPERWAQSTQFYRNYVWDELIGRLPDPALPPEPRTRLIYDEPKFRGYEVTLSVWPDVFAYGILLVPKGIAPSERRPVVVCQHGLEGRPSEVADPKSDSHFYHRFAARLADEGFVTFSPQNPYIFEDRFRSIQRKAHPLKLSLFSFILGQHQAALTWLGSLPFVDASRIGFYGLSYGGKTAVRVPPLLPGYALSICSGDFNEWVWKTTSIDAPYTYMLTREYDMLEFNLANIANYSELASLMAPRPFMVERGHSDGVSSDEWVAYEFAKVLRLYAKLGIDNRARIEFFSGPHTIHGVGTFEFLREFLKLH